VEHGQPAARSPQSKVRIFAFYRGNQIVRDWLLGNKAGNSICDVQVRRLIMAMELLAQNGLSYLKAILTSKSSGVIM
jgi:hypothetical protein